MDYTNEIENDLKDYQFHGILYTVNVASDKFIDLVLDCDANPNKEQKKALKLYMEVRTVAYNILTSQYYEDLFEMDEDYAINFQFTVQQYNDAIQELLSEMTSGDDDE